VSGGLAQITKNPVMPILHCNNLGSGKHARQGYTLLELTISLPLLTLLMLGMGSAIHIAARAVPSSSTPTSATVAAAATVDRLTGELNYATSVTVASPTSITFVTPDRTGDGAAETVRYSWSGTAGAPLLSSFNGLPDEVLLPNVHQFTLAYDAPLNPASGARLLRAVNVQLLAPLGSTVGFEATILALNRPQLP
jgi:Tfp pilus assembly protein FimT